MLFQFGYCILIVVLCEQDEIVADITCQAEAGLQSEFSISHEWEGEFFPGIPKINYEVWAYYH